MRTDFEQWLLDNWSYDPDGTPTLHRPPEFVKPDGLFDVAWHERWIEERRNFWEEHVSN